MKALLFHLHYPQSKDPDCKIRMYVTYPGEAGAPSLSG